jgi:beta-glucosidase
MRTTILFFISFLLISFDDSADYLNPNLPVEKRVEDLISRMTLEEKVSQMMDVAKAIPRLFVPEYNWWNEALHGVGRAGVATVFPQAIGIAATWNTELMFEISDVISTEARAKHHEALRNNDFRRYRGLTYWSPNINIFRDPRWGRGQETYGEDPYLTSRLGVQFIKGLQGNDPKYFKLVATPKHFAVHSGPEPDRHTFDAITNNRDLYDTYLPAFDASINEAKAFSIMCAYNRYMGSACCGSPLLLQQILREDWTFDGYVVSDCWAIRDIFENHKITETAAEAAALAVKAGTDLNCGNVYDPALIEAIEKGFITEKEIDLSLKRLFTARFKLGMFDPPEMVKYAQIPFSKNDSEEHRALSVRVAQESIVLLKNSENTLPLSKSLKKIAVIGPTADSYDMLLGNYNGTPSKFVTPLQGIINKVGSRTEVIYEQGCNLIEEGGIVSVLSADLLNNGNEQGLKAEYFKNTNLEGDPFHTRTDPMQAGNLVWGAWIPQIERGDKFSIRWSGQMTAPATGEINFVVKGDDGYRLIVDSKVILEDWAEHEQSTTRTGSVNLEKGKTYDIKIEYFRGSGRPELTINWELLNVDHVKKAVELAQQSEMVIFTGGITAQLEGEEMPVDYDGFAGGDRTHLKLPKVQSELIKALHETGKPVVLVLSSGSALAVNWENENLPAIVLMWYPGQEGGTALADVLFGDYNPAGRLPVTFYKSVDQLPDFKDYNMKGRTYRYFEGDALYTFGYGLSYTKFEYEDLQITGSFNTSDSVVVSVNVKNIGSLAGDEVVQLYIKDMEASYPVALQSLQGFKRISLKAGGEKRVTFILSPKQLAVIDNEAKFVVEPGSFKAIVGGSFHVEGTHSSNTVVREFVLKGEPYIIN